MKAMFYLFLRRNKNEKILSTILSKKFYLKNFLKLSELSVILYI